MYYTQLTVTCSPEFTDILIAELSEAGFDTFQETETGFDAYAEGNDFSQQVIEDVKSKYIQVTPLTFSFQKIEKKNWNEEWEKNYEPIDVDGKCLIRAEFHKAEKKYRYEIIITPKMSFGTGHHQTTYLMIKNQMSIDHKGKRVMDAGCGTAILSIMASKLGAREVEAFDIDEWSVVNGEENKSDTKHPHTARQDFASVVGGKIRNHSRQHQQKCVARGDTNLLFVPTAKRKTPPQRFLYTRH
jgi:ribosomal protein L11 methyltransferase